MAFNPRELSVLAYANGFTLWHYRIEEAYYIDTFFKHFLGHFLSNNRITHHNRHNRMNAVFYLKARFGYLFPEIPCIVFQFVFIKS